MGLKQRTRFFRVQSSTYYAFYRAHCLLGYVVSDLSGLEPFAVCPPLELPIPSVFATGEVVGEKSGSGWKLKSFEISTCR